MQKKLVQFTYEEATELISSRQVNDERLSSFVLPNSENIEYYILDIDDVDVFLNIHWHQIESTLRLNELSSDRQLMKIASAFIESKKQYSDFNLPTLKPPENTWFDRCQILHDEFNIDRIGIPVLQHFRADDFRKQFDNLYITDGNHRLLVYAVQVLLKEIEFQPFKAIYLHYLQDRK